MTYQRFKKLETVDSVEQYPDKGVLTNDFGKEERQINGSFNSSLYWNDLRR